MSILSSSALTTLLNYKGLDTVCNVNVKQDDSESLSVEDGEIDDEMSEENYLGDLLQLTQKAIQTASSVPTGMSYSILSSGSQNVKKTNTISVSISNSFFDILNFICSDILQQGPHSVSNSLELVKNYEKFADSIDSLLSKVDQAVDVCDTYSPHEPMSTVLLSTSEKAEKSLLQSQGTISNRVQSEKPFISRLSDLPSLGVGTSSILHSSNSDIPPVFRNSYWTSQLKTVDIGRFVPRLTYKPHGNFPLQDEILFAQKQLEAAVNCVTPSIIEPQPSLPHPYFLEIQNLNWENTHSPESSFELFETVNPILYTNINETPLVWIRTEEDLDQMIQELSAVSEIAIDLEHHSHHSYRGITCLIQCSTRNADFIIDPIYIQDALIRLNMITANPKIIKIFHGADNDILWLQRDFSIYIVNMFDTCQAARALNLPGGASLANLLKYYCNITTNKTYQLADWRIRPLLDDMIHYARSDTHYLLYIFDRIRNDILKTPSTTMTSLNTKNCQLMRHVLDSSRHISLKCYTENPPDFHMLASQLLSKSSTPLNPSQFNLLVSLMTWRNNIARLLDKNPNYIVSNMILLRIAAKAPRTWSQLQLLGNPLPRIIQEKAADILDIIKGSTCESNYCPVEPIVLDHTTDSLNVLPINKRSAMPKSITPLEYDDKSLIDNSVMYPELIENFEETSPHHNINDIPSPIVSIMSCLRKKNNTKKKSCPRRDDILKSRHADGFEMILCVPTETFPDSYQRSLNDYQPTQLLMNRQLLARAIGCLVTKDFIQTNSTCITNIILNPSDPVPNILLPSNELSHIEDESSSINRTEILGEQPGATNRKRRLIKTDLDYDSNLKKNLNISSHIEKPFIKKQKCIIDQSIVSSNITHLPSKRLWLNEDTTTNHTQSSIEDSLSTLSSSILKNGKKLLPATILSKAGASLSLPMMPIPQLFGNSSAVSAKNKSTGFAKKRKKFGL